MILPAPDARALDVEVTVEASDEDLFAWQRSGAGSRCPTSMRLHGLSCHYNSGKVPIPARPELALSSALTMPEPTNFIQAVLRGISDTDGAPGLTMPAYASSFSDADVARLAAYLRRTRTNRPPWGNLEEEGICCPPGVGGFGLREKTRNKDATGAIGS